MILSDFDHFRTDKRVGFKTESVNGETLTSVCYNIADSEFWKQPLALECRGSVFDATGKCVARPFEKFFNLGENDSVRPDVLSGLRFDAYEKRDGSLLFPVQIHERIVFKTRKTFRSDLAIYVNAWSRIRVPYLDFCTDLIEHGFTPLFEWTSPSNRIVLDYGQSQRLVVLAARHIESGLYMSDRMLSRLASDYQIPIIQKADFENLQAVKEACLTQKDIEGWVLVFENGLRVKCKTRYYHQLHRIKTWMSERDIAELCAEQKSDDLKGQLIDLEETLAAESIRVIEDVERRVVAELSEMQSRVETIAQDAVEKNLDTRDLASQVRTDEFMSLIMQKYRGRDPDYMGYWKKHRLPRYSTKSALNPNF